VCIYYTDFNTQLGNFGVVRIGAILREMGEAKLIGGT